MSLRLRVLFIVCVVLALLALPARGNPYESFLDVETEQDLYDALSVRQISADTFERLLDLLARGVDLDRASRQELYELPNLTYVEVDAILAHRAAHGGLGDGRGLVAAGILEQERLLAISPFLQVRAAGPGLGGVRGWVQAQARASWQERGVPPLGLRVRAAGLGGWTAGAAVVLTRQRLDEVRFDPNRRALIADAPAPRASVAKAYLRWDSERAAVLLGSYRAGFGQRLVFDNSGAEQPAGFVFDDQLVQSGGVTRDCKLAEGELPSPCSAAAARYVAPDLRWREALFGAAVSVRRLELGAGALALHAWASYAARGVYQYELVDLDRCADARRDADFACAAPPVQLRPAGAPLAPTVRHAYQTLPAMFGEALLGGNATYWLDRRARLGATGYLARTRDLVDGVSLGTQEGARLPGGQRFGAVGIEATCGAGALDLAVELARSFDELSDAPGLPGGGGFGVVARVAMSRELAAAPAAAAPAAAAPAAAAAAAPAAAAAAAPESASEPGPGPGAGELELSARYYQATFVNPYARPVAAADELEGQRARDEAGVRARGSWAVPRGAVRGGLDLWITPSTGTPKLSSYLRGELRAHPRLSWGGGLAFDDKDLAHGGAGDCFEGSGGSGDDGEPEPCRGKKLASTARLRAQLAALELSLAAQHELLDDGGGGGGGSGDRWQQRLALWLIGRHRWAGGAHLRGHLRFRDEALGPGGGRRFTGGGELRLPIGAASLLAVRLDGELTLGRASSSSSSSSSAHTLSLGVTYDVAL